MSRPSGPRNWAVLTSISLVSFAVLAFEVSLTRIFAVLLNYHYVFVAVSGAVCGLGLGGFGWHLLSREGKRREVGFAGLGFALTMPASIVLLFAGTGLIGRHLWAAIVPLLPFTFAGAFLAEMFRARASESGRLYQADLLGAGLAAMLVVPLIGLTGALHLVLLLGAIAGLATVLWAAQQGHRGLALGGTSCALLLLAAWPASVRCGFLRLPRMTGASPVVSKAMLREANQSRELWTNLDTDWSAYARTDLVRIDSPESGVYALQLFTDGDNPSQMMPFHGELSSLGVLRRELPFIAYDLSPHLSMLSIGPGAGRDFLWGRLAGFTELDGVEINASMATMMARYRRINGDLYHRPGVNVTIEDGRSFVRRSHKQYDLINSTVTQTATTGSAGQALVESYIHTREAFSDYYRHLTPNGRYTLVTQSGPAILRAAFTALAVMQGEGVEEREACKRLAVLALPGAEEAQTPYRYLLIWKKSSLDGGDRKRVERFVQEGVADPLFLPWSGGAPPLAQIASGETTSEAVLSDGRQLVNLRPVSDDRPFFLDLAFGVPVVLQWFLLGSFGVAAGYSAALLMRRRRGEGRAPRWLAYFAALGAGFMLVEIPLIQKFILFLGQPTLSLAAILFYLLIGASLGSRMSQAWPTDMLPRRVMITGVAICAVAACSAAALSPALDALLSLSITAKVLVMGLFLLPLGVALGIPFPSGLRVMSLTAQDDVPWMWGVNGLMSVVGSTLAAAGAKRIGFNGCLLAAALIYASVALMIPRVAPKAERRAAPRGGKRRTRGAGT